MWFRAFLSAVLLLLGFAFAGAQSALIAPGDRVSLSCEEEPSLNRDYTITEEGLILVDFLGAVKVAGLSEEQAADRLAARLVEDRVLRKATVRVRVVRSRPSSVRFVGAVQRSGETPLTDGMRLSDVVAIASPTEAADLARVSIRSKDGKTALVDFAQNQPGKNDNNPLLKDGDEVSFPVKAKPDEVTVLGSVVTPGAAPFEKGMTARKAIAKVGGFTSQADLVHVQLAREGAEEQTLDLSNAGFDTELRPGDKLVVGVLDVRRYVKVVGAVNAPGSVPFVPGMTLREAIKAAGGLRRDARESGVKVVRTGERRPITVDLAPIRQGLRGDVALTADDRIEVPQAKKRGASFLKAAGIALGLAILGL